MKIKNDIRLSNVDYFTFSMYFITVGLSFTLSYIFFIHQFNAFSLFGGGNTGDAGGYIIQANNFMGTMKEGVKTYGYPLFLKLIGIPQYSPDLNIFNLYVLIVQYLMYVISVFLFSFSVTQDKGTRLLITAGLLLNINLLTFFCVTLAEPLSVSMLLISGAVFWGIKKNILRAFFLGICTAFAMEVRPANLWLYLFFLVIFTWEFFDRKYAFKNILLMLLIFCIGSLISFAPQLYFNYVNFHKLTPLPAGTIYGTTLAGIQYVWGKEISLVSFSLAHGFVNNTQNPFAITSAHSFTWLSINGLSYAVFKLFIMFSHNDLFVYQLLRETHQKVMILFSSFSAYFGLLGLSLQRKKIPYEKFRAILVGLFFCILLHMFTALEDRFTFAICLLLLPFAMYQFWQFFKEKNYKILVLFFAFFLFMNLFNSILEALSPSYVLAVQSGKLI